jgi:hypothetical protein
MSLLMTPTKPSSASSASSGPTTESLFSRLIVGPILFISFLLSLLLVDRKTSTSIFGAGHSSHEHYHSHQRKLARSEMDEAFQRRSRVIAGMCMVSGILVAVVLWAVSVGVWWLRGASL